jgi:hypothetical protein
VCSHDNARLGDRGPRQCSPYRLQDGASEQAGCYTERGGLVPTWGLSSKLPYAGCDRRTERVELQMILAGPSQVTIAEYVLVFWSMTREAEDKVGRR